MFERIYCKGEYHEAGGPGTFRLGRAEELLSSLAEEYADKVQLIYLDPPFGTGDQFTLTIGRGKNKREFAAYSDTLERSEYLALMRRILEGCHKLLSPTGALYMHIDYRYSAHFRLMLDEIFGEQNFQNEIIWAYKSGGRATRYFARKHDVLLYYRKSKSVYFDIKAVGIPRGPERRNHMKRGIDEQGRLYFSIKSGGRIYRYYEDTPVFPSDVWDDIEHLHQRDPERTGYATQKPEALLRRVILASSQPGSLVMDLFSGSGTTACVAARHGRQFLVADSSPVAMQVCRSRLLKTGEEVGLFDGSHHMTLEYPDLADAEMSEPPITVENGKVCLTNADDVSFWAIGTVKDGCFHSKVYDRRPITGTKLVIPQGENSVVEISDHSGHVYFWKI